MNVKVAAKLMGKKGGKSRSPKKVASSRKNAAKAAKARVKKPVKTEPIKTGEF